MSLFGRRSPEGQFWDWFAANQSALAKALSSQLILELTNRLRSIHPGLMWEFGDLPGGTHEFTISAEGNREIAPFVLKLIAAAPELAGWRFVAFRQPSERIGSIRFQREELSISDLTFSRAFRLPNGQIEFQLEIPGLNEDNHDALVAAAVILLDGLIGEEKAMNGIAGIDFAPETARDGSERSFIELKTFFPVDFGSVERGNAMTLGLSPRRRASFVCGYTPSA